MKELIHVAPTLRLPTVLEEVPSDKLPLSSEALLGLKIYATQVINPSPYHIYLGFCGLFNLGFTKSLAVTVGIEYLGDSHNLRFYTLYNVIRDRKKTTFKNDSNLKGYSRQVSMSILEILNRSIGGGFQPTTEEFKHSWAYKPGVSDYYPAYRREFQEGVTSLGDIFVEEYLDLGLYVRKPCGLKDKETTGSDR